MATETLTYPPSVLVAGGGEAIELERLRSGNSKFQQPQTLADLPEPSDEGIQAVPPLDRATLACLVSAGYAFFCAGINDGSLGPLIPYLLESYVINTNFVSIFYGVTFFGWFCAALTNSHLTSILDTGAILAIGAALQALAHALRIWLPPFGVFAFSFFFATLGQGYQDTHANTYVSRVKNAPHRWLGFIHAMYMAGCLVGPFVATAVSAANQPSKWQLFYSFPLGLCSINVAVTLWAFRRTVRFKRSVKSSTGDDTEETNRSEDRAPQSANRSALKEIKETLRLPSVWLLGLFFFFFLGVAITASGE